MLRAAACLARSFIACWIDLLRGLLLVGIGDLIGGLGLLFERDRDIERKFVHVRHRLDLRLGALGQRAFGAGCNCSDSQRSMPTACRCAALEALMPQVSRSSSAMSCGESSAACAAATA